MESARSQRIVYTIKGRMKRSKDLDKPLLEYSGLKINLDLKQQIKLKNKQG